MTSNDKWLFLVQNEWTNRRTSILTKKKCIPDGVGIGFGFTLITRPEFRRLCRIFGNVQEIQSTIMKRITNPIIKVLNWDDILV